VDGAAAVPRAVSAINAAVHNGLQGQYTAQRKTLTADEALGSSLKSSMSSTDYRAVDRFLEGVGPEDADRYGRLIRDRLLIALEHENSQALARATSPWGQDSPAGISPSAVPDVLEVSRGQRPSEAMPSRRHPFVRALGTAFRSTPAKVVTWCLLAFLSFGLLIGGTDWYETVQYHHWVHACDREGGTVVKTGTSSTNGGRYGGATSTTKYVCLGPDGKVLSHHSMTTL
jgi:hypothetical protein